jgi:hypothetical protein
LGGGGHDVSSKLKAIPGGFPSRGAECWVSPEDSGEFRSQFTGGVARADCSNNRVLTALLQVRVPIGELFAFLRTISDPRVNSKRRESRLPAFLVFRLFPQGFATILATGQNSLFRGRIFGVRKVP